MKIAIFDYLKRNNRPIKRAELLNYLRSMDYTTTDREMRAVIEDMCITDGYSIASSEQGYAIIHTEEELDKAMKYLKAKAFPLFKRADSLQKSFHKDKNKQLSFEEFFQIDENNQCYELNQLEKE
mgnify:FL=1